MQRMRRARALLFVAVAAPGESDDAPLVEAAAGRAFCAAAARALAQLARLGASSVGVGVSGFGAVAGRQAGSPLARRALRGSPLEG